MIIGDVVAAAPCGISTVLAGRAMQGLGLALVPLCTSAARSHLEQDHAARLSANLPVTVAAGTGLGYPALSAIAGAVGPAGAYQVAAIHWVGFGDVKFAIGLTLFAVPLAGNTSMLLPAVALLIAALLYLVPTCGQQFPSARPHGPALASAFALILAGSWLA